MGGDEAEAPEGTEHDLPPKVQAIINAIDALSAEEADLLAQALDDEDDDVCVT